MKKTIFAVMILLYLVMGGEKAWSAEREWSAVEKTLAGCFVIGQLIDYGQTNSIFKDDRFYELNPLVDGIYERWGKEGWVTYKVGSTIIFLGVAHFAPKYRKWILGFGNLVVWGCVANNYFVGLKITF